MLQFLHLPLFAPTFIAVLFRPLEFFRAYHELVTTRQASFWDLNTERPGDPYLGPVKFAALAITISNLFFPLILALGERAGAFSPDFLAFADWAREEGHLDPLSFTGVGILDDFLRSVLVLIVFYGLGRLIALISGGRIPARFAAGYFFYWNAWDLLGALASFVLVLMGVFVPLYETALPMLVDTLISLGGLFMFLVFPILFWPRIMSVTRLRTAAALVGGLAIWIAAIAVVAPLIVDMPDFG
jgi:hypothetical protein